MDDLVGRWLRLEVRNSQLLSPGLISLSYFIFLLPKAGVFLCLQAVFGTHVIGIGHNHIYHLCEMYL